MSVANIDAIRRERKIRWKMYIHFVPTSDGRFKKINKKNKHVLEILGSVKWDKFLPSGRNLAAESTKNIKLPAKMSGGIKSKSFTNTKYTEKLKSTMNKQITFRTNYYCLQWLSSGDYVLSISFNNAINYTVVIGSGPQRVITGFIIVKSKLHEKGSHICIQMLINLHRTEAKL